MQRHIFEIVAARKGNWIGTDRLIDRLYADDPDGGPLNPHNTLRSQISKMNRAAGKRIIIGDQGGDRGYRLATGADGVI